MTLTRPSGCKVNLLLNILGKRADGFHELETVMQSVALHDELTFQRGGSGIQLSCSNPALPVDSANLVHRAATAFLESARIADGISIHLTKNIPMAAGLGGGSGNAAITLVGLNEIFGKPLSSEQLFPIAARLGSDVPFFLQHQPAIAIGRGEQVESLEPFAALRGAWMLLIHPGFGISTPWAYQSLAKFPEALRGRPGRARELVALLAGDLTSAGAAFYNSLEAPALHKHPILALYQEFLRAHGATATLMSGSGSATFALVRGQSAAEVLREKFIAKFGSANWTALAPL
ncbi:MAG: 4-(cytidine 5'-diphospho)-2-C-methyl-D-erythritol kinase [Pedosphaera sp.]|nr:4-(cytidine 5'-diphospho)-2-C-methyl-D-erythritol kinase [Pedosphaera sp.]